MGRDQSNKDEQILLSITLIQNPMMEVRVASLQGDQTMGKYIPLLGINISLIDGVHKKSCKKCPLTFTCHQPCEKIFLEWLVDTYFLLCLIHIIIEVRLNDHSYFS